MLTNLPIIDAHAHVIPQVCGRNRFGEVVSERWGGVLRGGNRVPMLPPTCADSSFPVAALVELMDRESQPTKTQNPII